MASARPGEAMRPARLMRVAHAALADAIVASLPATTRNGAGLAPDLRAPR